MLLMAIACGPMVPGAVAAGSSAGANSSGTNGAGSGDSSLAALESLIAALGAARAEKAVDAIGHGFVLMEAQKRIAATERKLAHEAAEATAEPEPASAATEEVKNP
ncbi:MAG: hypothetical protein JSS97_19155, partial [Actinobacteria bacterium]|nr:hypothetical protein [Actinomycetota bacterium]